MYTKTYRNLVRKCESNANGHYERLNSELAHTWSNTVWVISMLNVTPPRGQDGGVGFSVKKIAELVLAQTWVPVSDTAREVLTALSQKMRYQVGKYVVRI